MKIEFDLYKSKLNQAKHGVSFEEATTSLLDPLALVKEDNFSENEQRWILVGMSAFTHCRLYFKRRTN